MLNFFKVIGFILFLATSAKAFEVPRRHDISDSCRLFVESIQNDYEFGWVETSKVVFENEKFNKNINVEDLKKDQKIFVFYYFLKRPEGQRLLNPILFINGGPGFSSHGQAGLMNSAAKKWASDQQYDFIFFDQRGTGCSTSYPRGASAEIVNELKSWSSFGISHDVEQIRKKILGDRKWSVLGQSYGAYAAFRYIELFPESLNKVLAHGNAIGINDFDRTMNRIYSQHRVTESFTKKFPDAKKRLALLKIFLSDKQKCFKNTIRDYCGYEITTHFIYSLGYTNNWPHLDRWLKIMVPTNQISDEGVQNFVDQFITSSAFYYRNTSDPETIIDNIDLSLHFFGLFDWDTKPLTAATCQLVYQSILKKYKVKPDSLLLNECQAPMQFEFADKMESFIKGLQPSLTAQFIDVNLVAQQIKNHKLKVYSYSGEMDCYVPYESFAAQNKILGKTIQYVQFKTSGHDGFATEPQIFTHLK